MRSRSLNWDRVAQRKRTNVHGTQFRKSASGGEAGDILLNIDDHNRRTERSKATNQFRQLRDAAKKKFNALPAAEKTKINREYRDLRASGAPVPDYNDWLIEFFA